MINDFRYDHILLKQIHQRACHAQRRTFLGLYMCHVSSPGSTLLGPCTRVSYFDINIMYFTTVISIQSFAFHIGSFSLVVECIIMIRHLFITNSLHFFLKVWYCVCSMIIYVLCERNSMDIFIRQ